MKTLTINDIISNGSKVIPSDQICFLVEDCKPKTVFVPLNLFEMYVDAFEELEDFRITLKKQCHEL